MANTRRPRIWLAVSAVALIAAPTALLPPAGWITFERPVVTGPAFDGTYGSYTCPSVWAAWTGGGLPRIVGIEVVTSWYRACVAERAKAQARVEILVVAAIILGALAGIGFVASVTLALLELEESVGR